MEDEKLALELTKIQISREDYTRQEETFSIYENFLDKIEHKEEENRIAKIKRIYKENEGKEGSWCGYNGIQMLDKIKKIIENKKES